MLITALALLILLLFFFLWIFPSLQERRQLHREFSTLTIQLQDIKQVKTLNEGLDASLSQLQKNRFPIADTTNTAAGNPAAIIKEVREMARKNRLTILQLNPVVSLDRSGLHSSINVSSSYSGNLDACQAFLTALLESNEIDDLTRVKMVPAGSDIVTFSLDFIVKIS